jgi:hypothetical protein
MEPCAQLDERVLFTLLNVPLLFWPSDVTIVMQATMISASITAYSTAVGPSSLLMKRETCVFKAVIGVPLRIVSDFVGMH